MSSRQDPKLFKEPWLSPSFLPWRLGGSLLLLCSLALPACRKTNAAIADAAPPPVLDHSVKAGSKRAGDDFWQRASAGDPIELARLADREGAAGLLDGLEEGGAVGLTALLALPHADDADVAYRRLGEIIHQLEGEKAAPVVEAALAMAHRPRRQREPLDPPGAKFCAEALLEVTKQKRAPEPLRAKAVSALRLLAEQDLVDRGAIPDDFDMP